MNPIFFPTTIVLVDDNNTFLSNLSLQIDSKWAVRCFNSATKALAFLNSHDHNDFFAEGLWSLYPHREDADYSDHIVNLHLSNLHAMVYDASRFNCISVLIVDFDMPHMNGIELCQQINDPHIKKILLTGKADEHLAVEAFNAKIIDRFIRKQDHSVISLIHQSLTTLQKEYFDIKVQALKKVLSLGSHLFLNDPVFRIYFDALTQELNIVEHYITSSPEGILMLNDVGEHTHLVVHTHASLTAMYEIALDKNAPQKLLTLLSKGKYLPYFWQSEEGHYDCEIDDWKNFIYPIHTLKGIRDYFILQVKERFIPKQNIIVSYKSFLEMLDENPME